MIRLWILLGLLTLVFSFPGLAATLEVCPSGCQYSTIQAAINAANPGDTIEIGAGTYFEGVSVSKPGIRLIGAGRDLVVLNGTGKTYALSVNDNGISISGITIWGAEAYVAKISHCSNFRISDSRILGKGKYINSAYGGTGCLDFHSVLNATASDLEIAECSKNGVAITNSTGIKLRNLKVQQCGQSNGWAGIAAYTASPLNIPLGNVQFNLSGDNEISNTPMGIYAEDKLYTITPSLGSTVTFSNVLFPFLLIGYGTVTNADGFAMGLGLNYKLTGGEPLAPNGAAYFLSVNDAASAALLATNVQQTVIRELNSGNFHVGQGMSISAAINAAQQGATILLHEGTFPGNLLVNKPLVITSFNSSKVDCGGSGHGFDVTASDVTIKGIEITNCPNGIVGNAPRLKILENKIHHNTGGVRITSNADTTLLNYNAIKQNTEYGIDNSDSAQLDATKNWWDTPTGPNHLSNPTGTGDRIFGSVNFMPWLCAEYPPESLANDNDGDGFRCDDCDDTDPLVNPSAVEVCDGKDNDCNAATSDGSGETPPKNSNQQGVCLGSVKSCTGGAWVDYYSGISQYEPEEATCDGLDNDCDGSVDEGLTIRYYQDFDADLFGDPLVFRDECTPPSGYVRDNTDCDDTDSLVNPSALEVCDGKDNDCDGAEDEGLLLTFYRDFDGDGWGYYSVSQQACSAPSGYVADNTDCNDTNNLVYPGALDPSNDGIDNNCHNDPPTSLITAPAADSWQKGNFNVVVSDTDPDEYSNTLFCEYRVMVWRFGDWQESRPWIQRPCNAAVQLTVGPNGDCYIEGNNSCQIRVRSRDKGGLLSPENPRRFSIDWTAPNIRVVSPAPNSIIPTNTPRIEVSYNDRGSGINPQSAKMWVDDELVDAIASSGSILFPTSQLSEGIHRVKVEVQDKIGNIQTIEWSFTVDTIPPNVEILSPKFGQAYRSRTQIVSAATNERVRMIRASINGGAFVQLCRDCSQGSRTLTFREGFNTVRVVAEDYSGNTGYSEITFYVDSVPPKIHSISPANNAIVSGTRFSIRYTETELESIKLRWGTDKVETLNWCPSGRNLECWTELDLTEYNGQWVEFQFELQDKAGSVLSEKRRVWVDTNNPSIKIFSPAPENYPERRIAVEAQVNEMVQELWAIVNGGRPILLCRDCQIYNRKLLFNEGENSILLEAIDYAGNKGYSETVRPYVDSVPPVIHRVQPSTRTIQPGLVEFNIRYTEEKFVEVTLFWRVLGGEWQEGKLLCSPGRNIECNAVLDLSQHHGANIEFYFQVNDKVNMAKSGTNVILIDNMAPVITINKPEEGSTKTRIVELKVSIDEPVTLLYSEDGARFSTLCSRCQNFRQLKTFRAGEHTFWIQALDAAGNKALLQRNFRVT